MSDLLANMSEVPQLADVLWLMGVRTVTCCLRAG